MAYSLSRLNAAVTGTTADPFYGAPAVLVVNARGAAHSILATLAGFLGLYPDSGIRGVILNNCSPMLYPKLKELILERFPIQPLGFLPPLLWRRWRHWWAALALSGGVSCLIEFLQLFLGRSVDVDDVLLNVLGGFLGYLLFCLLPKKLKNR